MTNNQPLVVTTAGTKVHRILTILLEDDFPKFPTYAEATEHLNEQYAEDISKSQFRKTVNKYNNGKYSVDGNTWLDTGSINLLSDNSETGDDHETSVSELSEAVYSDDSVGDEIINRYQEYCKKLGITPEAAGGSYVKFGDVTVRIPTTKGAVGGDLEEMTKNLEIAKEKLKKDIKGDKLSWKSSKSAVGGRVGVLNIADIHLGAFIQGLQQTPNYSLDVIKEFFMEIADKINSFGYGQVHVNFLGDLVETGFDLMHSGQWKEIENGIHGVKAVKICVDIMHQYLLSDITNLVGVNIISGNHDRSSADKSAGTEGYITELIAWGLELIGYDLEYNPLIISKEIDGIQYILSHGDQRISKLSTEQLALQWGSHELYNLNLQGHLHSLSKFASQRPKNIETLKIDDNLNNRLRKMILPSLFGGNAYSENGGWTSQQGYVIIENNGKGTPNVFDFTL